MKFGERIVDMYKAEKVLNKDEFEMLKRLIDKVDNTKRNYFKIEVQNIK